MSLMFPLRALLLAAIASSALVACTTVQQTSPASPAAVAPSSGDNARAALDWAGTYRGTLPCADCEGIETTVVLSADGRYRSQMRYLGKPAAPFNEQGTFTWNTAGNTVILQGANEPTRYFVEENRLVRLTMTGARVQGPLAAHFVLKKLADPAGAER